MKLRIYKSVDEKFYIQKRILRFLLFEWWIKYPKGLCCFDTVEKARERVKEIEQQEWDRKHNTKKGKEITRFTI